MLRCRAKSRRSIAPVIVVSFRARAAVDAHRVEVPLARMLLGRLDVERRAIRREFDRGRSRTCPVVSFLRSGGAADWYRRCRGASSRRARRGTTRAGCPAASRGRRRCCRRSDITHPRFVVRQRPAPWSAGGRIDEDSHRSVLSAARTDVSDLLAVGRQDERAPAHVALRRRRRRWQRALVRSASPSSGFGIATGSSMPSRPAHTALAGLEIEDRQPPAILRVADLGPAGISSV